MQHSKQCGLRPLSAFGGPLCLLIILAGLCAFLLPPREAYSCSVPVFRYAIERWRPDAYKGIFVYRNEINEKDQVLLNRLKQGASNPNYPLNLLLQEVDAATFPEERLTSLLKGPVPDTLPVIVVWYPGQMGKGAPIWVKQLTPSFVETLLQSPKRKEMAERLISGDSVVWVFIPSGNIKKDERAKTFIRQELDKAVQTYSKSPFTILSGGKRKKLTYGFPILTVSPDDPAERLFVDMLLKSESDLYEHTDEPMVFPVFGRGRSLGCLFGEYITEKNIREASAFLSGACSCEVKNLNPGVDLLVAAPWDMVVMNSFVVDEPLPELTGVMPEPVETTEAEDLSFEDDVMTDNSPGLYTVYGVSLFGVILMVVISGFIIGQRRRDK
jgi:hypothetical protein